MNVTKRKKITIGLLVVALAFSVAFYAIDSAKGEVVSAAVLKSGSTGSLVKTAQQKLKSLGYYTGNIDGIYGSKTVAAVKSYQRAKGLTADGIIGAKTAQSLGISLSSSGGSYSANDVYLLAKVVYAEARGEPYTGKVAVAAVVLNRVKSSAFPNTISGVVYQPWAFTAVNDGQINLTPDQSAKNAAQDALNGWDPTYGCIYYYNPKTATSSWIRSRKVVTTIGKHVFAL